MFLAFPSARRPDDEAAAMIEIYLDAIRGYETIDVAEGCRKARNNSGAFPPSAGELRKIVGGVAADRCARERASQPKLAAPARGIDAVPESDRPAMKARIQEMLASWRAPEASQ